MTETTDITNTEDIEFKRLECSRHLKERDVIADQIILAELISTPEDRVHPNSLCQALTGWRKGARSQDLIERAYTVIMARKKALYPDQQIVSDAFV